MKSDKINENDEFTYMDLINIFLVNKKKIFIFTILVSTIVALIAFFILDPIFFSSATIKTTSKSGGIGSLLGADAIPDIGDISNLGGGSVAKELALYENILVSRRCVEEALIKFNIIEEMEFKYMFDAVKYFRGQVMVINKDKIAGTMEIGAYDKDPLKAKDMADFLVYELNKINTELNIQNAKNNKEFIQGRFDISKLDLQKLEDSLKDFQDIHGIAPDLQVQAAVRAEFEMESEIKSEEIKLELLSKILSPDEAEIETQQDKISELKKQLSEIKNSTDSQDVLTLKGKPAIILNYLRLRREVEIQNRILTTLIPILEQAKIEEKRETPSVLILDPPVVPDKKIKPKRLTITLFSFLLSFVFAYLFFIAKSKWKLMENKRLNLRSDIE